jgi:DNA-binding beta-propeller fold protein YncE
MFNTPFPFAALLIGLLTGGFLSSVAGYRPEGPDKPNLVAVTVRDAGKVVLLDREKLTTVRTVEPKKAGAAAGPMLVVEDSARRAFYVGNFDGGLGKVPMNGEGAKTLDLGGVLTGLAISPDGRLLAVNGAHDLTLRLIDLDTWKLKASLRFGTPTDEPRHTHLTHGMASTHPIWLPDGSGVLTQDNIHEEVVLVGPDGKERARRRMRSGVHTFLTTPADKVLALAEGTVDGKVRPAVVVLDIPSLEIVREIPIPLARGEPAKLHHGALSPDGQIVVVANMGPMHGEKFGKTVAALRWRTGEVLWHVAAARNAGHVGFLDKGRVIVLGHRDPELYVLDVGSGKKRAGWRVPGASRLGHSLAVEADGTVLIVNSTTGQLVHLGPHGVIQRSARLGDGVDEASLSD